MEHFDFAFAGCGVAACSLALHLVRTSFAGARILLVDRNFHSRGDHALSFWSRQATLYEPIVARTWRRLKVAGPGFAKETALQRYRYQTMYARDFFRFAGEALDAVPGVTRLQGEVSRVQDGPDGVMLWVDGRPYRADWLFDSRYDRSTLQARATSAGRVCLWHYFHGWEIETPSDRFDPQVATLMDLRLSLLPAQAVPQQGSWRFFYVLPYTGRRALVELVSLQADYDGRALPDYVDSVLGIDRYDVVNREAGAIPLSDQPFPRRLGRRVLAIGTVGGRIKPSTGYGFTRMQQDAAAITYSLQRKGHPFDLPDDRHFFHFCDRLMLRMLAQRGDWALPLFCALLQHNPLERVLSFLDEQTSPLHNALLAAPLVPRLLTLAQRVPSRQASVARGTEQVRRFP